MTREYIIRFDTTDPESDLVLELVEGRDVTSIAHDHEAGRSRRALDAVFDRLIRAATAHHGGPLPWTASDFDTDQWLLRTGDISVLPHETTTLAAMV